jgi:hypothetical protein
LGCPNEFTLEEELGLLLFENELNEFIPFELFGLVLVPATLVLLLFGVVLFVLKVLPALVLVVVGLLTGLLLLLNEF